MKTFYILSLLVFLLGAATAIPVDSNNAATVAFGDTAATSTDVFEAAQLSENKAITARHTLEGRAFCQSVRHVVRTIGTSSATIGFIFLSSRLASKICSLAGYDRCEDVKDVIELSMIIVYYAAAYSNGAVPEPLGRRQSEGYDAEAVNAAYTQWWENLLGNSTDTQYENIESWPVDTKEAALAKQSADEPDLVSRVLITGLRTKLFGNGTHAASSLAQDVAVSRFSDGTETLHLPVTSSGSGGGASLKKRADAPGFKVSYTTRFKTKLTYMHQREMASAFADYWAFTADTTDMSQMMGLAATEHSANFYFRIISETRAFDLSYESVDLCGGMADLL